MRAEAEWSRGPSAYQPNALPLGQTDSSMDSRNVEVLTAERMGGGEAEMERAVERKKRERGGRERGWEGDRQTKTEIGRCESRYYPPPPSPDSTHALMRAHTHTHTHTQEDSQMLKVCVNKLWLDHGHCVS